jgi:hypothetical protein
VGERTEIAALIARAIVHLNFKEPDEAQVALFAALTEINFPQKENSNGNRHAA